MRKRIFALVGLLVLLLTVTAQVIHKYWLCGSWEDYGT